MLQKFKTILKLSSLCLLLSFSLQGQAEQCNSEMEGWNFYAATITSDHVRCSYRYCYYGCIYKSYTIKGKFVPEPGTTHWKKEDPYETCYYSNTHCRFEHSDSTLKTTPRNSAVK